MWQGLKANRTFNNRMDKTGECFSKNGKAGN
jgi:hypothetical protein